MKEKNLNKNHSIKLTAIIILLFLTQNIIHAQVFTRILDEEEKIEDYIPWYFQKRPDAKVVPSVDIEAILEQDREAGSTLDRFGVKSSVNLTEQDGSYYQLGDYYIWKIQIWSEDAKSLNFEFINLNLPNNSQMFIYGMDEKMIHGPIISKNIHEGIYSSDIIYGDYAVIGVVLHKSDVDEFSITIKNVIHGIDEISGGEKAFGDSQSCNVNTVCPLGAGWEGSISAVCLILRNNVGHCTGTLINSECSDLTPYLLTANHCLDGNPQNWVFRFNYETIDCAGATEPASNLWISFSGAQLRASWEDTDFALLELDDPIVGVGVSLAGWDRQNIIPSNSIMIHHPRGDVKKITVDAAPPVISSTTLYQGTPLAIPLNFFQTTLSNGVNGDFGVTEGGSSGCGLFNSTKRIIGQLYGGDYMTCTTTGSDAYGRFSISWTGGGANDNRLSNWLGGTINPLTLDQIAVPSISGDGTVCTVSEDYILLSPIPGSTVTWNITPTYLFGSSTSGNGITATLWAANSNSKGLATLTYTMSGLVCGDVVIEKDIWIGINNFDLYTIGNKICAGDILNVFALPIPLGSQNINIDDWSVTGAAQSLSKHNNRILIETTQVGTATICGTATNECGTESHCLTITIEKCDSGNPKSVSFKHDVNIALSSFNANDIHVYPNPVTDVLTIEMPVSTDDDLYDIQLSDAYGKVIMTKPFSGKRTQMDTKNLSSGLYFLRVQRGGFYTVKRFVIH